MDEPLLRLKFKGRRVAIATDNDRVNVAFPIQLATKHQRACFNWVTNPERPFKAARSGLHYLRRTSDYHIACPVIRRYAISAMKPAVVIV